MELRGGHGGLGGLQVRSALHHFLRRGEELLLLLELFLVLLDVQRFLLLLLSVQIALHLDTPPSVQ